MHWECCAFTNAHFQNSPVSIPDSTSVAGLFALCCPLPLAVDADFTSNLLLGFGSGSVGLSLKSCAAGAAGSVAAWLLCAALNVTFDGSDDSAYQHHCVPDEPVRFFVSFHCVLCGHFCFAHSNYTISECNGCQFCVALQCYHTITKQVNEFRNSLNRPRFSYSVFFNATLLMMF